jgi:hypothetical protein
MIGNGRLIRAPLKPTAICCLPPRIIRSKSFADAKTFITF